MVFFIVQHSFLKGIHHGFGKFCGSVIGGMLIKSYGKKYINMTFSKRNTFFSGKE
jgi:hypothetical protein